MFQNINKFANKKISKDELRHEIELSQERNEATPKLMEMVYIIAYKVLRTNKFRKSVTIDWMEDAASSCVIKFAENFHKFDLKKTNQFGELCSPYAFYMTGITRKIYDTLREDYYKYFELKRNLMAFQSCHEETDPFFDEIYQDDNSDEKDYCKTFKNKYNEEEND